MKKFLLIFLFVTSYGFAQNSGITYQAVIYNPNGEELPGVNNPYAALTEQSVCLQFGIIDASGTIEYQENVQVTTDAFGMVNLLIGTHLQTSGYAASFSAINWGADAKFLKVDIDIKGNCTNFEELSNQPFTYVPFAYYSPASDIPGPAGQDGVDGIDGTNGTDGVDGTDGIDGTDGVDALNSLIRTTTEDSGSNCENGGTKIEIGIDTNKDGILNDNEIDSSQTKYICNGIAGIDGTDGTNGGDGTDGFKSLIKTTDESQGSNCENGGTKIETGIDTNNDGLLDASEIDPSQTRYICNGKDGADGTDGVDGFNSNSGLGGGADIDTGFYLGFDNLYAGGQTARLSGDGNIVTFSPPSIPPPFTNQTDKVLIYSLADGSLQPLTSITYLSTDSFWNLVAFNYDGSIALINNLSDLKTYFYKFNENNNNYELTESSSEYFYPIDWSINFEKILAYDGGGVASASTGVKVWSKNGNDWIIEASYPDSDVSAGNGFYPKFNKAFTVSVAKKSGSFNGLSGNGKVTVYDYNNGVFTQKGNTIFGETDGASIGDGLTSVSSGFDLSESGDRITVTSANTPYPNYRSIIVYDYDNLNNVWNKYSQNISPIATNNGGSTQTGRISDVYLSEDGQILTSVTHTSDDRGKVVRYRLFNDIWIQYESVTNVYPISFYGTRSSFKSKTFVQYLGSGQGFFIKIFD